MNLPIEKINLINNIVVTGPAVLAKWFIVIGLGMYAFFAFVVTRQVRIMTQTIESDVNIAVVMFGWVNFLLAVLLVVAAVVLL